MYWPNFFTYLRIVTFLNPNEKRFGFAAMLSAGNDRKKTKSDRSHRRPKQGCRGYLHTIQDKRQNMSTQTAQDTADDLSFLLNKA